MAGASQGGGLGRLWGASPREIGVINPILTGVSSAARALESLLMPGQTNPASSSAGAFSTGQGLPTGPSGSPQPSNASSRFAPAALGFLTALQDPESAAAGFIKGAETAIGQDVKGVAALLEKLKDALTGAGPSPSSVAASALSTGSAAAGALSTAANLALFGLLDGHHHHHGVANGAGASSAAATALSLAGGARPPRV
jgi:hypothetical protein